MEDNFLKDSKAMSSNSNPVLALRKAALAAMPKGPLPCTAVGAGKRVEIFDPREGKKRRLNPYGAAAKQLYLQVLHPRARL